MNKILYPAVLLVLLAVGIRLSVYTVDASEYAYITVLGEHVATFDGADEETGAGLHFGWPWPIQSVQRLDRRLQQLDLPATELLTHDPEGKTIDKMLLVEAYVCWRIVDRQAVDLFVRRIGTVERANAILEPRIRSELGAAIGQMRMDDLVSTETVPGTDKTRVDQTVEGLHQRLLAALRQPVRDEYGIELVDIRLRRFSHPAQVRESIFDRIKSERNKKVTEYLSEGERLARNIETTAEEKARKTLAEAHFKEVKLKGEADAEAMRIRNEAHQQDPEFYAFLKKMEKLQSILGEGKTVLLLSTHRPLFESLFQPPRPPAELKKLAPPSEKKGGD
jgi:membrane protease subunit HflC